MFLRHRDRSLKKSLVDVLQAFLVEAGWGSSGVLGSSLGPVVIVDQVLGEEDLVPVSVGDANRLFVGFGDQGRLEELELGGELVGVDYPVFLDVLARNATTAGMIAEDVRDRLTGLFGGGPFISVVDAASGVVVPGLVCEVREVWLERPRRNADFWVSLKVGLELKMGGGV